MTMSPRAQTLPHPNITRTIPRPAGILLVLAIVASVLFGVTATAEAASQRDNVRVGDTAKNLCLDVDSSQWSNGGNNGSKVVIGICGGRSSNKWTRSGSQIMADNGKCLDVHRPDYDNSRNGGKVQLWGCSGGPNQQWEVSGNIIRAKGTNLCLDVHRPHYDNATGGGKVQVWDCNGWINQSWSSVFISSSTSNQSSGGQQSGANVAGTKGSEVASRTCESHGMSRNTCTTGWNIAGVWVKGERISRSECIVGHSFGFSGTSIWVNHGCRANFGISGTRAQLPVTPGGQAPLQHSTDRTKLTVIGDSFTSGEGIIENNTSVCARHNEAYGHLLAQARNWDIDFHACSGATISDLLGEANRPGQVNQLSLIASDSDVIIMTIGGNDLGFSDMLQCFAGMTLDCVDQQALDANLANLRGGTLSATYRRILERAPGAKLYVLNYPIVLENQRFGCSDVFVTNATEVADADRYNRALNSAIAASVREYGNNYPNAQIEVIDVSGTLDGACDNDNHINHVLGTSVWPWDTDPDAASFHPTREGHRLLFEKVNQEVD